MSLKRLYVEQNRLIQELCGGMGVVGVKSNVGVTADACALSRKYSHLNIDYFAEKVAFGL